MRRRWLSGLVWLLSLVSAVSLGWWAAREALSTPENPVEAVAPVTYEVVAGSMGRSIRLTALAEWPTAPVAVNRASGVVTVEPTESSVGAGAVLFEVEERPVVAGVGEIPAYRDLTIGDAGEDVAQLQRLLTELGYAELTPDGRFGHATEAAVRSWQKDMGVAVDGSVGEGDVVWFVALPVRLVPSDDFRRGMEVSGGEELLGLSASPRVWVPVSIGQRNLVPESADVTVTGSNGGWNGRVGEAIPQEASETDRLDLLLVSPDGGPICGDSCIGAIPVGGRSEFGVEIVVVADAEGPVVPASAITSRPDGSTYVTTPDGAQVSVSVVASDQSLVLVDGIAIGSEILVFGPGE